MRTIGVAFFILYRGEYNIGDAMPHEITQQRMVIIVNDE